MRYSLLRAVIVVGGTMMGGMVFAETKSATYFSCVGPYETLTACNNTAVGGGGAAERGDNEAHGFCALPAHGGYESHNVENCAPVVLETACPDGEKCETCPSVAGAYYARLWSTCEN